MTLEKQMESIQDQLVLALRIGVNDLHNEIVDKSPVDKGDLKADWKMKPVGNTGMSYVIRNNMDYASYIWAGRLFHKTLGRWYGSVQGWGLNGGNDVLRKHEFIIQNEFDKIQPKEGIS